VLDGLEIGLALISSAGGRDAAPRNGDGMFDNTTAIIMLIFAALIYMLPTLIAFGREHPRRQDIAVINILLGWTLIGWLAIFLWASLARVESQPV
jgi:Superinfection immunity protein